MATWCLHVTDSALTYLLIIPVDRVMPNSAPPDMPSLVSLIYDSIDDPVGWIKICDGLQSSFQLETVSIFVAEKSPAGFIASGTSDVDERSIADYNDYFYRIDPIAPYIFRIASARSIWRREQFISDEHWAATEIWNDLLRRRNLFHVAGVVAPASASSLVNVNFFHTPEQGPVPAHKLDNLLSLVPHLASALRIKQRLAFLMNERNSVDATLNSLSFGVILVDEAAQVVSLNTVAELMLAANDGLRLREKKLRASELRANSDLERLIAGAIATSCGRGSSSGGILAIERSSLKRPYTVRVLPLPIKAIPQPGGRLTCCAVLISDPERRPPDLRRLLQSLYGLTAAEARVAQALCTGATLDECAEHFGVSREAVRKHLAQIFRKTETSRQAELIRLIHLSIPAVRDISEGAGVAEPS